MKILIVDDNEDNRVMQETVLKAKGYTVECADNGSHALEVAARFCPDIIVSDILMPEMDGFGLCRAVKADKKLKKIPFVFYSASYTGSKDKELAAALGASRYIVKPMTMKEFVEIIEEMVKEYEDGKLTIPEIPKLDDNELEQMYEKVLVNKLSEKVVELEKEITRRENVEETLRESEEKFRTISATANDAIIMADRNNKITYWNKAAERIFDYSADNIIGKTLQETIIPSKYHEAHSKGMDKFINTGHGTVMEKTVELIAIKKAG